MGAGISQVTIEKMGPVIMKDVSLQALGRGQQQIEKGISGAVKKKKISKYVLRRIRYECSMRFTAV